jgi:hypothetical protein
MTDTTTTLAKAIGTLIASMRDHPLLNGVAGTDASMDLGSFEDDPSPGNAHAMAGSAEEFIDDVSVSKIPETPELVAAQAALKAYLLD